MITGKVAAIVNERELAINRGEAHGVKEGMRFAVRDNRSVQVTDPETGEALGTVQREKIRVRITEVQPGYSIGRTYEKVGGSRGLATAQYLDLFSDKPSRTRTLRTDDALFKPLQEVESLVKRGDEVVEVSED